MIDYMSGVPMKYFMPSKVMTDLQYRAKIEKMKASGEYLYSRKYDGVLSRGVINQEGKSALQLRNISRKTGVFSEVHQKVLWWNDVENAFDKTTVIIGELYQPKKHEKDVAAIMRALWTKARVKQADNPIQWRVFDVLCYEGENLMDMPMIERHKYIEKVVKRINNPLVIAVEYREMDDKFDAALANIYAEKGEGVVAYRKSSVYKFNTCGPNPYDTCKIERHISAEVGMFIYDIVPSCPSDPVPEEQLPTHQYWMEQKSGMRVEGDYFLSYCKGNSALAPITEDYYKQRPIGIRCGVFDKDNTIVPILIVKDISDDFKDALRDHYSNFYHQPVRISASSLALMEDGHIDVRNAVFLGIDKNIDVRDCTFDRLLKEC